jgi:membrane fusion protein (multidrug efflux system)
MNLGKRKDSLKFLTLTLAFGALSLIVIGCSSDPQGGGFTPPPTPIEEAEVAQSGVVDKFHAVGTIQAAEAITVVSEIDAAVTSLPFAEGQEIAKGGLIAQLDDGQARASVASAEATRDQAKVSFERTKEIVDAAAASKQDLDDATARLKVAQAQLDQTQVMLDKTQIIAPFSGVLGTRQVSPGAYLRSGDAITTLTQISTLKVKIFVPERILPYLSQGSHVTVSSPAFPDEMLEGTVSVVDPVINEATRSIQVIARVNNPERRLRPGMSADVSIVLKQRPTALTVPDEAVFAEGNQDFVYLINADGTVSRTAVILGTRQPGSVEIRQGLSAGQKVVRTGHQKLYDGAKVMPAGQGGAGGHPGGAGAQSDAPPATDSTKSDGDAQ